MNLDRVEKIAEAVLYEGYMLYPYRPSSIKNQQRWNFGVLYPPSYCEQQTGAEASTMQTQCLVQATAATRLTVKLRFLQIVTLKVGLPRDDPESGRDSHSDPDIDFVDRLEVAGRVYHPWQEAIERELTYTALDPVKLSHTAPVFFTFSSGNTTEHLRDEQGQVVGVLVRESKALNGSVQFDSERCLDGVVKITVRLNNRVPSLSLSEAEFADRKAVLSHSLVSAHTILGVEDGEFVSLLDPPPNCEEFAMRCKNIGTWPVLATEQCDVMLSSPIILYDFPQIAPESAGNFFDSTEIDEILSLRILTLTDDEKREMRQSDDRTRAILERTESMPEEQFMKLHGVLRGFGPQKEEMR